MTKVNFPFFQLIDSITKIKFNVCIDVSSVQGHVGALPVGRLRKPQRVGTVLIYSNNWKYVNKWTSE